MPRRRLIWYGAALAIAAAIAAAPAIQDWLTVDACLDSGGAWVKQARICIHEKSVP